MKLEDWDSPGRDSDGQYYLHPRNLFHHIGVDSTVDAKNAEAFCEM